MPRGTPSRSSGGRSIPRLFGLFGGRSSASASPANCSTPVTPQSQQPQRPSNGTAAHAAAPATTAPSPSQSGAGNNYQSLPSAGAAAASSNASLPKSPARMPAAGVPSHLGPDGDVGTAPNDKIRALMDDIKCDYMHIYIRVFVGISNYIPRTCISRIASSLPFLIFATFLLGTLKICARLKLTSGTPERSCVCLLKRSF